MHGLWLRGRDAQDATLRVTRPTGWRQSAGCGEAAPPAGSLEEPRSDWDSGVGTGDGFAGRRESNYEQQQQRRPRRQGFWYLGIEETGNEEHAEGIDRLSDWLGFVLFGVSYLNLLKLRVLYLDCQVGTWWVIVSCSADGCHISPARQAHQQLTSQLELARYG